MSALVYLALAVCVVASLNATSIMRQEDIDIDICNKQSDTIDVYPGDTFVLRTNPKGNDYKPNQFCPLNLLAKGNEPVIVNVLIQQAQLESSVDCRYDYFSVGCTKMCDSSYEGFFYQVIVPAGHTLPIAFSSDVSVQSTGPVISVVVTAAGSKTARQPVGGSSTEPKRMAYENLQYSEEYAKQYDELCKQGRIVQSGNSSSINGTSSPSYTSSYYTQSSFNSTSSSSWNNTQSSFNSTSTSSYNSRPSNNYTYNSTYSTQSPNNYTYNSSNSTQPSYNYTTSYTTRPSFNTTNPSQNGTVSPSYSSSRMYRRQESTDLPTGHQDHTTGHPTGHPHHPTGHSTGHPHHPTGHRHHESPTPQTDNPTAASAKVRRNIVKRKSYINWATQAIPKTSISQASQGFTSNVPASKESTGKSSPSSTGAESTTTESTATEGTIIGNTVNV